MAEDKIKVLVVDDEEDFRQVMKFWLESKGYLVLTGANGEEAVKLSKEKTPDIIFLDFNMPVMDGIDALKRIREFDKLTPIILISAYVDDGKMNEAIKSFGVSGVFYKGKDFQEGLSLLESALRTHRKLKK
jgi:CheY-like chemotaxis protein